MIVLASLLVGSGASAQTAGDASRTPSGNLVRNGPFQVAYSECRRLPQSEVNCVDQWYRAQGSNLGSQIQRGIGPSSSTVAKVRAECRGQARAPGNPVSANTGSQSLASASDAADRAAANKAAADQLHLGLISGPIIFSLGGSMFLLLQRRKNASEMRL